MQSPGGRPSGSARTRRRDGPRTARVNAAKAPAGWDRRRGNGGRIVDRPVRRNNVRIRIAVLRGPVRVVVREIDVEVVVVLRVPRTQDGLEAGARGRKDFVKETAR